MGILDRLSRVVRRQRKNTTKTKTAAVPNNLPNNPWPKTWPAKPSEANWAHINRLMIGRKKSAAPPPSPPTPNRGGGGSRRPSARNVAALVQLATSAKHAEGRLKLQIARLKARPNLAKYAERAQTNLKAAQYVSAALAAQLAKARAGTWAENALVYNEARNKYVYAPRLAPVTERITRRFARRNTRLGGRPTLNRYDVKHANQLNKAKAALNALTNGSRLVNEGDIRLLRGQLKRVQHKEQQQTLFNWEKRLLANKALVKGAAHLYAHPANTPAAKSIITVDNLAAARDQLEAAYAKIKKGERLSSLDQTALLLESDIERAALDLAFSQPPTAPQPAPKKKRIITIGEAFGRA